MKKIHNGRGTVDLATQQVREMGLQKPDGSQRTQPGPEQEEEPEQEDDEEVEEQPEPERDSYGYRVYVSHLNTSIEEDDLYDLFEQ